MPQNLDASENRRLPRPAELALILAISAALLVPCFWQSQIEAGDLSSHVYNAWLASQIRNHPIAGLTLAHPWTNVLCDWALQALIARLGAQAAQRIVVACAVLLFFWGAYFLVTVVSRNRAWLLSPCLAMLAYGLVFHLGFLNYYVSTGLCLWIVGLLWELSPRRIAIALPLALLAILAHPMPVAWAAAVLAYGHLLRRIPGNLKLPTLGAGIALIAILQAILMWLFPFRWSINQAFSLPGALGLTGAEQVVLFGSKYVVVAVGLILIWCLLFLERLDQPALLSDPIFHIWILELSAYILMPGALQLPQYQHVLAYIPQRLSLFNALLLCALVGSSRQGRGMTRLSGVVATVYFASLFIDVRAYNRVEDAVADLAGMVPPGSRFVAEISDSNTRLSPLLHVADRACIGRCFSFANYEPATGQFRIRVTGPSPAAVGTMQAVQEIEQGHYIVPPEEAPVYSVCPSPESPARVLLRRIEAGQRTCSFTLPVSPEWWFGDSAATGLGSEPGSRSPGPRTSN